MMQQTTSLLSFKSTCMVNLWLIYQWEFGGTGNFELLNFTRYSSNAFRDEMEILSWLHTLFPYKLASERVLKISTVLNWLSYNKVDCLGIFRLHLLHAVHRCGVLLPVLHEALVCLCVGHTDELCRNGWTNHDAIWGLTRVDPRNQVLDGGPDPPREEALLRGNMCMSALHIVCLLLWANVPAQRTLQTKALCSSGDKIAMQSFSKLL